MSRGTKHSRRNSLFRSNMRRNSSVPELTFRWFEGANAPLIAMANTPRLLLVARRSCSRAAFWDWQRRRRSQFAFEIGRIGHAESRPVCGRRAHDLGRRPAVLPLSVFGPWCPWSPRSRAQDAAVEKVCIWTPDKDLVQCVSGARVVQVD